MTTRLLGPILALFLASSAFAVCGDGTLDAGEECDDENTVSGDGCSSTCVFEGRVRGREAQRADEVPGDERLSSLRLTGVTELTAPAVESAEHVHVPELQADNQPFRAGP
jgi:cysteine-rich repeat protein